MRGLQAGQQRVDCRVDGFWVGVRKVRCGRHDFLNSVIESVEFLRPIEFLIGDFDRPVEHRVSRSSRGIGG